jgi:hypothetical protein
MASGAKRWLVVAMGVSLALPPRLARGQTTSAAEVLFEEGRRLMDAGDFAAGCAKLAESQRIDPAGGTLMNLAACHERAGRTATAWAEFNDALAQARRDGRHDRIDEASRQIAALAPQLARITVNAGTQAPPDLEVLLDGTLLGSASWGTPIPVDPGQHELRARAPGRVAQVEHIAIEAGMTRLFVVPPLESTTAPSPIPRDSLEEAPMPAPHPLRFPALVVGGLGLAALGVGTGFGLLAARKKSDSESNCTPDGHACSAMGASLLRDANNAAWVSDIGFGAGAAALAVATFLFFVTPSSTPAPQTSLVAPLVGVGSFGLGAQGRW